MNSNDQNQSVEVINPSGRGPFIFVCEHASNAIPGRYQQLGLDDKTIASHAAWDPGALATAVHLSRHFDSPLVAGTVSRLVYDCNRPPSSTTAITASSEAFDIPVNAELTEQQRNERIETVYLPFRETLTRVIDQGVSQGTDPAIVTLHSFTPLYHGKPREVELGILHDDDSRLADKLLANAARHTTLLTRRNEPYGPQDGVTHTLQEHALPRKLHNAMIEIRNDLIASTDAIHSVSSDLCKLLQDALPQQHAGLHQQQ